MNTGDLDIRSKLCYLVTTEDRSLLFAIDSRILDERLYRHVADFVGNVDAMFIGMECERGADFVSLWSAFAQASEPEDRQ